MNTSASLPCRIAVTGYGTRSSFSTFDELFSTHESGASRLGHRTVEGIEGMVRFVGAPAPTDAPFEYMTQRKWLKYMGPQTQLAVWGAGNALVDAGLMGDEPEMLATREKMALFLTTGPISVDLDNVLPALRAGRTESGDLDFSLLGERGLKACSPMMPFHTLLNMPIGLISMVFGLKGHNAIYYPDAEQSLFALATSSRAIEWGRFETALVGATAHLTSLIPLANYHRLGWLAPSMASARPFDPEHDGWGLSDASAMLVLESESHALARGARIHAVVEIQPTAVSTAEMLAHVAGRSDRADLVIVSGTRNRQQDLDAIQIADGLPVLSLEGVMGYSGAASLPYAVAAACHLLNNPTLYDHGAWLRRRRVDLLASFSGEAECLWARLRIEALS